MIRSNRVDEQSAQPSKLNFFGRIFSKNRTSQSPKHPNQDQEKSPRMLNPIKSKSPTLHSKLVETKPQFDKKLFQDYCKSHNSVNTAKNNLEKIGTKSEKDKISGLTNNKSKKESFGNLDFNDEMSSNYSGIHKIPESKFNLKQSQNSIFNGPLPSLAFQIKNKDTG